MDLDDQIVFARECIEMLLEDTERYKTSNAVRMTVDFHKGVLESLLKLKRLTITEKIIESLPKN